MPSGGAQPAVTTRLRPAAGLAALGALLFVVAGLLDAEPIYVPGVACVLLAACAAGWVLSASRGVQVTRRVGARRAVEDAPVDIQVSVRSPRPLPTGAVLEDLLGRPAPLSVGQRATTVTIVARFGRRGRKVLAPPRVELRDPFGLATRTVTAGGGAAEILVLPRVEPVRAPHGSGDDQVRPARRGRPAVAAEVELDGVRQHRPGTPASRIYWPALARRQGLLERRLAAETDTSPLIVLDPRGAARPEDLDAAVRAAASLAVDLAHHGGCAVLVPGERRPVSLDQTLAGWPHLHARLALVEGHHAPALGRVGSRRGELLYVSARRLTAPPRALAHAPGGGRLLVVPAPIPGRRAAFEVAGCIGYELSDARVRAPEAVA